MITDRLTHIVTHITHNSLEPTIAGHFDQQLLVPTIVGNYHGYQFGYKYQCKEAIPHITQLALSLSTRP